MINCFDVGFSGIVKIRLACANDASVCLGLSYGRGKYHSFVVVSLWPCQTVSPFDVRMFTRVWVKWSSYPASHNVPMDMRVSLVRPGRIKAFVALGVSVDDGKLKASVAVRTVPLGRPTFTGVWGWCLWVQSYEGGKYDADAPVSAMALCRLWVDGLDRVWAEHRP